MPATEPIKWPAQTASSMNPASFRSLPAVEAAGLVKRFGDATAVDGLDLSVAAETVVALLGPNGAGKTTTLRMLATLLRPDAGSARVLGHDVEGEADAVRARISLTGQLASVDDDLTGLENLVLLGRLLGHSRRDAKRRAAELLDAFGLADAAGRLVKSYSGGMRRRLDVAASIIVRPELLFLDEADQLADRIAVIDHGPVIAEGTSGELKASVGCGALHVRVRDPDHRDDALRLLTRALAVQVRLEANPLALSATVSDPDRVAHALAELARSGITVAEFALGQPSLDEVFLDRKSTRL